jgi:DNA-binding MarR family transcriptional regulator
MVHMVCTIHIMARDQTGRDQRDYVERLDFELTLLSRHEVLPGNARADRNLLDRSAYLVLGRLQVQQLMSLRELADALHLDISTINRQTAALLRQGLVERIPDPAGGIARKLRPTPDGFAKLARDRAYFQSILAEVIADWAEGDRRTFLRLLRRFNVDVETRQGTPWPRDGEQTPQE